LHDWEKNPHLYLTDSEGSFILREMVHLVRREVDLLEVKQNIIILMTKKQKLQQGDQSGLSKKQLKKLKRNLTQRDKLLNKRLTYSTNLKMNRQNRQNRGR